MKKPYSMNLDEFLYHRGLDVAYIEDGDTEFSIICKSQDEMPIVEKLVYAIIDASNGAIKPLEQGRLETKVNKKYNVVYFGALYSMMQYYKICTLLSKIEKLMPA